MPARDHLQRALRWLDAFWTPRRVLWAGWLLFVIYCYPGYMSTDSVVQLLQARGAEIQDWHPPVMAILWRWLDRIVAGPFPMLIVQSSCFLLGLAALLRRVMAPRAAAIVAALVLVFPPVLTPMAVIWKDSQMAGFLLAGTALLLSERRRYQLAGCGLLFLATAQRYNAPAATLPLVVLLFVWKPELSRWRRYAAAAGVWIAITALAFGANRALTERKMYAWHGSVALLDIVGMVRYAPQLPDDEVRERLAGVTIVPEDDLWRSIRKRYDPRAWFWLVNGEGHVLEAPHTEDQRAAVAAAWKNLLFAFPTSYLRHRWEVFRALVGLDADKVSAEWDGFTENPAQEAPIGHKATHSKLQAAWLSVIPKIDDGMLFRPWVYLLLGLLLLPLCRGQRLAFALLTSGVLNELSLFVAAPSADYRYSHWMIACTTIGLVVLFATRLRELAATAGE